MARHLNNSKNSDMFPSPGSRSPMESTNSYDALLAAAIRRVELEGGHLSQHQSAGKMSQPQQSGNRKTHQCPYDGCSYAAKKGSHLRQHVRSVHEGVRFPCDFPSCSYSATRKSYLKFHRKNVHRNGKTNPEKLKQSLAAQKGARKARQRKLSSQAISTSSQPVPQPFCVSRNSQPGNSSSSGNDIDQIGSADRNSSHLSIGAHVDLREENLQRLARVKCNERGELDFEFDESDTDSTDYDDEAIRELLAGFGVFPPAVDQVKSVPTSCSGDGDDDGGWNELPPMGDLGAASLPPMGDLGANFPPIGDSRGGLPALAWKSDDLLPPLDSDIGALDLLPPLTDQVLLPTVKTEPKAEGKSTGNVVREPTVCEPTRDDPAEREPKQAKTMRHQKDSERIQRALFTAPENVFQAARRYYLAKKEAREAVALAKSGKLVRDNTELMALAERIAESARLFFKLRQKEQLIPRNAGELGFDVAMGYILQHEAKIRGQHKQQQETPDRAQSREPPTTEAGCNSPNSFLSQNVDRVECGASGDSVRYSERKYSDATILMRSEF